MWRDEKKDDAFGLLDYAATAYLTRLLLFLFRASPHYLFLRYCYLNIWEIWARFL